MKLPAILTLKGKTSTVEQLSAAVAGLDQQRSQADRELQRLSGMRPDMLLTASNVELAKHDDAMAQCRREVEQADARRAVVQPELLEAQRIAAEQADAEGRQELHAAGTKALVEGRRILRDYDAAAAELAAKLHRLAEIRATILRANGALPEGKLPLEQPEAWNGRDPGPDRPVGLVENWFGDDGRNLGASRPPKNIGATARLVAGFGPGATPGRPGVGHRPLGERVCLPRISPDGIPYWQGSETKQQAADPHVEAAMRMMGIG